METIDIAGSIGLLAMVVLTINIVLGIFISTAYKKTAFWQKLPAKIKALKLIEIHNYTAYIALSLVLIHFILIPLDPSSTFTFVHLIEPWNAPHQALFVSLGVISFIALLVVVITTQKIIKKKIGTTTWKNIHIISYGTGLLFIVHGLVMDPLLKDRPIDFLDPEKLLVELCALVLLLAFIYRYQYKVKNK
ncbi:MAG: ferric reductase-like transmembrane domain-containing protein [Bacteroidetes bacterium]|nr:ferric reductase-like transmembrane domain-containing protein [Bacteroidota bacterium]